MTGGPEVPERPEGPEVPDIIDGAGGIGKARALRDEIVYRIVKSQYQKLVGGVCEHAIHWDAGRGCVALCRGVDRETWDHFVKAARRLVGLVEG